MSISIRLGDIADQVIFELNLPSFGAGEFITTTDMDRLLKSSARRLSGTLTRLFGDAFFAETANLSTVPDFDLVSLPDNFATMRSVHWVKDSTCAVELVKADIKDYSPESRGWGEWDSPQPSYRLESNVIVLYPTPTEEYTLRVNYTTGIFLPTVDNSEGAFDQTFEGQIFYEEWMIADLCAKIRTREQKDPADFLLRLQNIEAQMKEHLAQRDRFTPSQVVDRRCDRPLFNRRRGWY